jgi:hypothetical protein
MYPRPGEATSSQASVVKRIVSDGVLRRVIAGCNSWLRFTQYGTHHQATAQQRIIGTLGRMIWADEQVHIKNVWLFEKQYGCGVDVVRLDDSEALGVRNKGLLSSGVARAVLTIIPVHVVAVWSVQWNLKLITRQLVRIEGHPPLPVALAAACHLLQMAFGLAATASQRHDSKLIYMAAPLQCPNDVT